MGSGAEVDGHETPTGTSDRDEVPPILPPRSPLRSRPYERSLVVSGTGESPPFGRESVRVSVADSTMTTTNQSIALSSNLTDMTTYSSLAATFNDDDDTADGGIDGSSPVLNQQRRGSLENVLRPHDRKPSETVTVDLSRVVEESEEPNPSNSGGDGGGGSSSGNVAHRSAVSGNGRVERIRLGQGRWPDDFFDAFQATYAPSLTTRPITIRKPLSRSSSTVSRSADTPRVMGHDEFAADLGALPTSASLLVPSPLAGRLTHRIGHSVDTPMLAPQPRDTSLLLPRESSPDSVATLGGGGSRSGSGRRWRPRPNWYSSYDEFGAKRRPGSRFESMANLGVASGTNASASDLMARNATEGSLSRQTLVVREEGKSPTHFVSFLCLFFRGMGGWVKDFYLITWL